MSTDASLEGWTAEVDRPDRDISLARAALALSRIEHPDIDATRYLGRLDELAHAIARIRETARLVGTPLDFARAPEEVAPVLAAGPADLIILDLTTNGWDYDAVLGFTTHALARLTQPLHGRCDRVVTKETLTQELPRILREGVPA